MKKLIVIILVLGFFGCSRGATKMLVECPAFEISGEAKMTHVENRNMTSAVYRIDVEGQAILVPRSLCVAVITNP